MDYQQTIDYLYNTTPMFRNIGASAYKDNLHNTHALDDHLNHPHTAYKTIHVAGTNGKGSCSSMLASYLQGLGYKVGLYTSPHIYSFRERIRVNGEMIPEEQVVFFVQEHRQFFEPLQPSFFELTTALAFDYFRNAAVDIAVIEVGLGGLLDCTNIITPLLSVITNISHDHTALLGKTLSQIARQKAGIIKPYVPVIIGETTPQTKPIFLKVALQNTAPIQFAQQDTSIAEIKPYIHHCELKADYQKNNIRTVFTATKLFPTLGLRNDISIFKDSLTKISQRTGLIGRWQKVASKPDVIIDTAHNKAGWKYLSRMLNRLIATLTAENATLRIVFAMVDDKDIRSVITLLPKTAVYYLTQPSTHRAIPLPQLRLYATQAQLNATYHPTPQQAFDSALRDASPKDTIIIAGSNYLIADIQTFTQN